MPLKDFYCRSRRCSTDVVDAVGGRPPTGRPTADEPSAAFIIAAHDLLRRAFNLFRGR